MLYVLLIWASATLKFRNVAEFQKKSVIILKLVYHDDLFLVVISVLSVLAEILKPFHNKDHTMETRKLFVLFLSRKHMSRNLFFVVHII